MQEGGLVTKGRDLWLLLALVTCVHDTSCVQENHHKSETSELAQRINYQACLAGSPVLSPAQLEAVNKAASSCNFQACLLGLPGCQLASLTTVEMEAVRDAAARRARIGALPHLQAPPPAAPRPFYPSGPALSFHGYPCTEDCSGHEAGYNWAEENDITDEGDCSGKSESFIEGCQSYVEEQGNNRDDLDEGEDEE